MDSESFFAIMCWQGMVNFNMKDTIGRGIRKVFTERQKSKVIISSLRLRKKES